VETYDCSIRRIDYMLSNEDMCVETVLHFTYSNTYKMKCINVKKLYKADQEIGSVLKDKKQLNLKCSIRKPRRL